MKKIFILIVFVIFMLMACQEPVEPTKTILLNISNISDKEIIVNIYGGVERKIPSNDVKSWLLDINYYVITIYDLSGKVLLKRNMYFGANTNIIFNQNLITPNPTVVPTKTPKPTHKPHFFNHRGGHK